MTESVLSTKPPRQIATRQLQLSVIVAAMIGLVFGIAQILIDWSDQYDRVDIEVGNLVESVNRSASNALWNLNDDLAASILVGLSGHSFISSSRIVTSSGTILARHSSDGAAKEDSAVSRFLFFATEEREYPLSIEDEGTLVSVGSLFVTVTPYFAYEQFLKRATVTLLGGFAKAALLCLALYWVFAWTTTRPLVALVKSIRDIDPKSKNLAGIHAPDGHDRDEFGEIAAVFNQQLSDIRESVRRLEEAEAELLDSNKALDVRVSEKTRALRIAVDEAERLAGVRANFLANMSHELRTPLNAIIGFSDAALHTTLGIDQEKAQEYFSLINRAGNNLHALVNELLDLSRIDSGRLEIEYTKLDVVALAHELAATLEPVIAARGNHVLVYSDVEVLIVRTDPNLLRQVLNNLIGNASKYTEKGLIEISLSLEGSEPMRLVLEVKDSGSGISPELLPKIFEPYVHGDSDVKLPFRSVGLGLTIVKGICETMGWEIDVKSTPDVGTTFLLYIPVAQSDLSTAWAESAE